MITNASITLYHKVKGRTPHYERYNIESVWVFGGHGASLNKGMIEGNDLTVRIPYDKNDLSSVLISIGDLIVIGTSDIDIEAESDLNDYYRIMTIVDNKFGGTPHIHLGAK